VCASRVRHSYIVNGGKSTIMNVMAEARDYAEKKVLIVGLGTLGGGLATTKWFLKRGASVTVTDLRSRAELAPSIRALGKDAERVRFVLGKHVPDDFRTHDLIVVNPAVPRTSPFLRIAEKAGKRIVNDASIFFDAVRSPVVAVTGTRGKTTTAAWVAHFLRVRAGGNSSSDLPLLKLLGSVRPKEPAVVELSSWQLERIARSKRGPDIAVITNIFRDHMNRYRSVREYAAAKANIFRRQTERQVLVLNAGNAWTRFFLAQRPRTNILLFSLAPLPKWTDGIFVDRGAIRFQMNGRRHTVIPPSTYARCESLGSHNIENLLAALLAAHAAGVPWKTLAVRTRTLPSIPLRQEIVLRRGNLTVVNDSAGTSPDATIAALRRFAHPPAGGGHVILLSGGTDKELDFREWARVVARYLPPRDLLLIEGSATKKMVAALRAVRYFRSYAPQVFPTLPAMLRAVCRDLSRNAVCSTHTTVLFSPGAASFEKFRNEFDRGEKFNLYCRQSLR
jgi:UDP-N-acetylmuramoylalanine--D-glutamate ligase